MTSIVEEHSEDGLREKWSWGVGCRSFLWRDSWSFVWKLSYAKRI